MKLLLGLTLCCFAITQTKSADLFHIDSSTYYSSYPDQLNWHQALRFCMYNGMYLVDVRSDFENKRILSIFEKIYAKYEISALEFWTSGTDLGSEGQFYWASTGHQILYTYWGRIEPSNTTAHENCVHYKVEAPNDESDEESCESDENCDHHKVEASNHKWNDESCDNAKNFICRDTFDVPIYKNTGCAIQARELF